VYSIFSFRNNLFKRRQIEQNSIIELVAEHLEEDEPTSLHGLRFLGKTVFVEVLILLHVVQVALVKQVHRREHRKLGVGEALVTLDLLHNLLDALGPPDFNLVPLGRPLHLRR